MLVSIPNIVQSSDILIVWSEYKENKMICRHSGGDFKGNSNYVIAIYRLVEL